MSCFRFDVGHPSGPTAGIMLSLTQTTGYAIKALTALAESGGQCAQTADIAKGAGVPKPYLSKIIQALARAGVVVAKRGAGGGITLCRPPLQISLLEIVEAVEGEGWLGGCLLGFDECSTLADCPTHAFWMRVRGEIIAELSKTSLASVLEFRALCRAAELSKRPKAKAKAKARARASASPSSAAGAGKSRGGAR